MMGPRQEAQCALFHEFSIERHVPRDHVLRSMDRFVDLCGVRQHLAPHYSLNGRPPVDPELMIRMLLVGYSSASRRHRSVNGGVKTSQVAAQKSATVDMACLSAV